MSVNLPDTGFEFYLLAIIIVLSLIAAVGAWRKPRTLTRDEAEDMFATAHERNCGEAQRLREIVAELQKSSGGQLNAFRTDTQEQLALIRDLLERSLVDLRTFLSTTTEQQEEKLARNLGDLHSNVTAALSEARRSQDEGIGKVEGTLQQVRQDVDRASTEVRSSIVELQRQHNEAKAQSAIQLCEALISSLGTLRNTIAAQIADSRTAEVFLSDTQSAGQLDTGGFDTDTSNSGTIDTSGPEQAPDGPNDLDAVPPQNQVSPS